MVYRLTDESVLRLWLSMRSFAEARIADLAVFSGVLTGNRSREQVVSFDEIEPLVAAQEACLVDVRPLIEFESGHLPGAVSIPVDELPYRMNELLLDPPIVVYSRGKYCLLADKAAAVLRFRGFRAARLKDGWAEWKLGPHAGDGGTGPAQLAEMDLASKLN